MTRTRALVAIIVFLFLASIWLGYRVLSATDQIQAGRQNGAKITCAIVSAVTDAGRQTIASGSTAPETALTRFLEKHGYPPLKLRAKQAFVAGELYAKGIAQRVEAQVGHKGDGLVRSDGTLDCNRFVAVAVTSPH